MYDVEDVVWKELGIALLRHTLREAANGDGKAILALAFSPVVHAAISVMSADVDPVKLLDLATRNLPRYEPLVISLHDEADALARLQREPAPVLDFRSFHNGHMAFLELSPWYIPLPPPLREWQAKMVERVKRLFPCVYVLEEKKSCGA